MIGHIIYLISFASIVLMTAYLSTTAEYYRRKSEKLKIVADFVKSENKHLLDILYKAGSLPCQNTNTKTVPIGERMTDTEHARQFAQDSISLTTSMYNPQAETIAMCSCLHGIAFKKQQIKKLRKKLFDILTDYEIGNYDNNIHQFYKDVYAIHNELMELAE